jgi:hypothetical protein
MRSRIRGFALAILSFGLAACAAAAPPAGGAHSPVPNAASGSTQAVAPPPPGGTASNAVTPPRSAVPRVPEVVLDPKQRMRPLPELKVENIGLHIGGGPNDADTKAPFLNAVAERFPAFMDCYRKSEDPAQGGRFGIDLHIARGGGHPRSEQPRTALRGPELRACLGNVFDSVEFQKPKHGPTTISYSLRFTLLEAP